MTGNLFMAFLLGRSRGDEKPQPSLDFIADASKDFHLFFVAAGRVRRVIKTPMQLLVGAGEIRTRLLRVVANRDDEIKRLASKLSERLGPVPGNIFAEFLHDRNRERMDVPGRLRTRAENLEAVAGQLPENAFRHMAAAGVTSTEKQDALIHDWYYIRVSEYVKIPALKSIVTVP